MPSPSSTGWQYDPNQTALGALTAQTAAEGNPNVATDSGAATASSPFLSKALQSGSGDSLTGGYSSWGATSASITNTDLQAANTQTAYLAQKRAQDAFNQQQAQLNAAIKAAQKANDAAQAKAYQQEQMLTQQLNAARNAAGSYSYGSSSQGGGALTGATGLSTEGKSQLAIARADGYNLSASNYDRTYRYNNQYSVDRNTALSAAYSWLGTHYVLDGETKQVEVDCSGLVQAIYSKLGFSVPLHSANNEKNTIPGVRTSFANLEPGDLVCWKDGSHIAIYAGNGEIIEAANTRVGTVRRPLWDSPNNVVGIHLTFADEKTGGTNTNLAYKKGL